MHRGGAPLCTVSVRANKHTVRVSMSALVKDGGKETYEHYYEGDDDMPAHIKSSLLGVSVTIPVTAHALALGTQVRARAGTRSLTFFCGGAGTWQGIYLCEFRNRASARSVVVTVYS